MGRISKLLCILLLTACVTAGPLRIYNAQPLVAEGWYEGMFSAASACVAMGRPPRDIDFDDLEWYVIPHQIRPGIAAFYSPPNRIYLDEEFVLEAWVIYHESLHAIINSGAGDNDTTFIRCIPGAP